MASWDDEDYEPEVKLPETKGAWDDEDAEEETPPPVEAPKPAKPAKSKKKEREERMNAKGRLAEEEISEADLTPKEREERAKARELAMMGADFSEANAQLDLGGELDFDLASTEWLGDAVKRAKVASALYQALPAQAAKTDPNWSLFMIELTERLTLQMSSVDVRKLSQKTKDMSEALKKANDEKTKKKNKPKLAAGKSRANDDFDDFGGGGGGGAAYGDDEDFM